MSAVSGKQVPVGLRHATVFALNANGSPAATNTTAYEGLTIKGAQAFDLNIPDPRKITHVGDDRPLQIDYLPPIEGLAGELRAARQDFDVYALLTDTEVVTVGESKFVGIGTDKQGSEPQVGLLLYQQALDENGARHWRSFLIPRATLYARPNGMNESPSVNRYILSPAITTKHLWETAFAEGTEGFVESQVLQGMHKYKPKLVAYVAATATTEFVLPAASPAADTAKMSIWVDGVSQTADITKATDKVQFATAPGNNKRVMVFYETQTDN
jgi:hypothetical protein